MREYVANVVFGAALAFTQSTATANDVPEPTAFERLATLPSAVVASSLDVGALTSVDSTVKVAVLVVEARADDVHTTSGVRFEISNNVAKEQIYLDKDDLTTLVSELALMARLGVPPLAQATDALQTVSVHGTESCWMPQPKRRILCPEFQTAPEWTGLRLWTFGGARFDFRGRTVAELRELVERAAGHLDTH